MAKKKSPINLEQSMQELEILVAELERGDLSLEDALARFERGIALTRGCQQLLDEAAQKVEMLVGDKTVPLPERNAPEESSDAAE